MRHGKKNNHLGRTDAHRSAMLSNMASSLITHKRINTTVAKAKALRVYVEPLLTKSKSDTTHNRRVVFSYLQDKNSVSILFRDVATKIADRPGGYTRIIKMGNRLGDNADMCFIELVDYNSVYLPKAEIKKAKTTRRGRSKTASTDVSFADAQIVPTNDAPSSNTVDSIQETNSRTELPLSETPHTDDPAEGKVEA